MCEEDGAAERMAERMGSYTVNRINGGFFRRRSGIAPPELWADHNGGSSSKERGSGIQREFRKYGWLADHNHGAIGGSAVSSMR